MTTTADVMVTAMARLIHDGDVVGVGLGTPMAVAAALLARATHAPAAHVLVGGAVDPRADLATCLGGPGALVGSTSGYVPHIDTMDMAESQAMTMQFLRPAQIDGQGNLNTSRIGPAERPTVRFPGGLATGDVPKLLRRIVAYLPRHTPRNLPDHVACVTGAGAGWHSRDHDAAGVIALVTDLAVVAFEDGAARLVSVHPGTSVDEAVAATGFSLVVDADVTDTPMPDTEERAALHRLDPGGLRAREVGSTRSGR
jgi:glutaconate CoA-transferase, subunit B